MTGWVGFRAAVVSVILVLDAAGEVSRHALGLLTPEMPLGDWTRAVALLIDRGLVAQGDGTLLRLTDRGALMARDIRRFL